MARRRRRDAVRLGQPEQARVQGLVVGDGEPARGLRGALERALPFAQQAQVPAVRGEAEDLLEAVPGERAREVGEHGGERVLAERERARERQVLRRSAEPERRQTHRGRDARAEALGQRVGDPAVRGEGQVRAVLLGGAERQHRQAAPGGERALELRPGERLERRSRLRRDAGVLRTSARSS